MKNSSFHVQKIMIILKNERKILIIETLIQYQKRIKIKKKRIIKKIQKKRFDFREKNQTRSTKKQKIEFEIKKFKNDDIDN